MDNVMQRATHKAAYPSFRFTEICNVIHSIPVDAECLVEVVGDPESASYEWLIHSPEGIRQHSDDGYGSSEVALRDGLIAYFGLPTHGVMS